MIRLRRIFFPTITIFSLLSCAATTTLWIRSYRYSENLTWANAAGSRCLATAQGYAVLSLFNAGRIPYDPAWRHAPKYQSDLPRPPFNYLLLLGGQGGDRDSSYEFAGFAWHEKRNLPNQSLHAMAVAPFWSLALLTALPSLTWAATRLWPRRRRQTDDRRCAECGYDLRATPDRCPECGSSIPANLTRTLNGSGPHC